MNYDATKIDEAVLALLGVFEFQTGTAWKQYDFDVMDRLFAKGYIDNPRNTRKSVDLTPEGLALAKDLATRFFASNS